jgi:hypothetical protein
VQNDAINEDREGDENGRLQVQLAVAHDRIRALEAPPRDEVIVKQTKSVDDELAELVLFEEEYSSAHLTVRFSGGGEHESHLVRCGISRLAACRGRRSGVPNSGVRLLRLRFQCVTPSGVGRAIS